jgi:LemA protein
MTNASSDRLLVALVGLITVCGIAIAVAYNRLIRRRNLVAEGKSGIDVQLKRRHDLIPRLVSCVQGYAGFEQSLLADISRLRENADQAASMTAVNERETALNRGLSSFFARVEAYPDLKANALFADLTQQLVATENALQYARRYYNGAVRDLNIAVESFPSNLVASLFGFRTADYFQVESLAERAAPAVRLTSDETSPLPQPPAGP